MHNHATRYKTTEMKEKLSKILNSYFYLSHYEKRRIIHESTISNIVDELYAEIKNTPMLPMIKVKEALPETYPNSESGLSKESELVIVLTVKGEFKRGSLLEHGKFKYWYDTAFSPVEIKNVVAWCKIPE